MQKDLVKNRILEINFRHFFDIPSIELRYLEFRNECNFYYVRLDSLIYVSEKLLEHNEANPSNRYGVYDKDVALFILSRRALVYGDIYGDTVRHKCMHLKLTEHMVKLILSSCRNEEAYMKNKKQVDSMFANIVNSYKVYRKKYILGAADI